MKEVAARLISDDEKETFIIINLSDGREIHVTVDKVKGNHHVYIYRLELDDQR